VSSKSDNQELNDEEFNEYLGRESQVSQHYRELLDRSVPPLLEQRILQQARTARAARKPATPRWLQWGAPLAVAASALLAVTILLRSTPDDLALKAPATQPAAESPAAVSSEAAGMEYLDPGTQEGKALLELAPELERSLVRPQPDAGSAFSSDVEVADPPAAAPRRETAAGFGEEGQQRRNVLEDEAKATVPASPSVASQAEERDRARDESDSATTRADQRSLRAMSPAAAKREQPEPQQQASSTAVQAVSGVSRPPPSDEELVAAREPEILLQQLRELREQGKTKEADELYKRLRAAHPDFPVPVEYQPK
jgi:hypothetical protein